MLWHSNNKKVFQIVLRNSINWVINGAFKARIMFFSLPSRLLVQALNVMFDMLNSTWKPPLSGQCPESWQGQSFSTVCVTEHQVRWPQTCHQSPERDGRVRSAVRSHDLLFILWGIQVVSLGGWNGIFPVWADQCKRNHRCARERLCAFVVSCMWVQHHVWVFCSPECTAPWKILKFGVDYYFLKCFWKKSHS